MTETQQEKDKPAILRKESSEGRGQEQQINPRVRLRFTELAQHSIDCIECCVNFLSDLTDIVLAGDDKQGYMMLEYKAMK